MASQLESVVLRVLLARSARYLTDEIIMLDNNKRMVKTNIEMFEDYFAVLIKDFNSNVPFITIYGWETISWSRKLNWQKVF